jgi:hypothetical protein
LNTGLPRPASPADLTVAHGLARYNAVFEQIETLVKLSPESDVDLSSFRTDLDNLLTELGTVRNYWVAKGNIRFIEDLSGLDERLTALIGSCAHQAANVPLMEALSEHYEITSGMLKEAWDLPEDLFANLYRKVLQGAAEPASTAATFWASRRNKPEFFDLQLKCLIITLHTVPAPTTAVATARMASCVEPIMSTLADRTKISAVVEAFAANMTVVAPLFQEFAKVYKLNRDAKSAAQKLADFEKVVRMPAEFLAAIYAETREPSVRALAKCLINDPRGHMPYTYFETMGLRLPQEMVGKLMATETGHTMVKLIEHAIMVPGCKFFLNNEGIKRLEPADRAELIAVVARAGLAGKEYWGRAQEVMQALLTQAAHWGLEETVKRELFASAIPPEFFAANPKLLTAKFGTDLGL